MKMGGGGVYDKFRQEMGVGGYADVRKNKRLNERKKEENRGK